MSDILQIFTGNPMSTFVGKKIEAATRPDLESDDWALNMEICDIINDNDDDAKDAVRAIKKRLQQIEQDRNFTITNRTLTVLETCDLIKLIGPKNNPPIELQERVLSLIERWAEAFRSQPDSNGVWSVYQDLKAKGVAFPASDPNSHVPIQTPQRTVSPSARPEPRQQPGVQSAQQPQQPPLGQHRLLQPQPIGQVILEGDGYSKISQDLTVVQSSIEMLNDIMKVLETPAGEEADWKLADDLSSTCRQMKDRIVELIERVANEDLTIELLRLNDELNNSFTKYERIARNKPNNAASSSASTNNPIADGPSSAARVSDASEQQSSRQATSSGPTLPGVSSITLNELSLIDFSAMNAANKAAAAVSAGQSGPPKSVSANPFAGEPGKDRPGSNQKQQPAEKRAAGLPEEISSVREQDFAEIENWLSPNTDDLQSLDPAPEFENFLANRALAGSVPESKTSNKQQARADP